MPYPHEHACRLNPPEKYDTFRRENCGQKHEGKCIDVVYGIKDGKSEVQTLRYKKAVWTEDSARSHCESREGSFEAASKGSEEASQTAQISQPEAQSRQYSIKAKGEKEIEILLYEEIGEGLFGGGISAKQFAKDLRDAGAVERISLRINSPGGNVFEGHTIYNILRQHKAAKTVYIDGLAASIASVIAMAGNRIMIADNAMLMIHPAWGFAVGNSSDMRKMADTLGKLDESIRGTYVKRTQLADDQVRKMMEEETWMNAQEALDYGFVDEITGALEMAACFDLSKFKYRHVPEQVPVIQAANLEGRKFEGNEFRSELARLNLAAQKVRIASDSKK